MVLAIIWHAFAHVQQKGEIRDLKERFEEHQRVDHPKSGGGKLRGMSKDRTLLARRSERTRVHKGLFGIPVPMGEMGWKALSPMYSAKEGSKQALGPP